jgi:hypothetical protein
MPDDTFKPTTDDRWISTEDDKWYGDGPVCWGHISGVEEKNARPFFGNWAGTGIIDGTGDTERLGLGDGGYMESEDWHITVSASQVRLSYDKYRTGSGSPVIKYKNSSSKNGLSVVDWITYTEPFDGSGWVKVRIEN